MSAKYKCDTCGRAMRKSQQKKSDYVNTDGDLLVTFTIDARTGKDICNACALKTILPAARKFAKENKGTIEYWEER